MSEPHAFLFPFRERGKWNKAKCLDAAQGNKGCIWVMSGKLESSARPLCSVHGQGHTGEQRSDLVPMWCVITETVSQD